MQRLKQSRGASFTVVALVYIMSATVGITVYNALEFSWWIALLIADLAATVVTFIFSLIFGNASVYDPYWSVQPPVILIAFLWGRRPTLLGVLLAVACVTFVVLAVLWVFSVKERNGFFRAALVLMLAGALGNIVDRIAFGYVRDFIYFELIDFAVFNFADSGLCVGCGCMIVYIIFFYRPEKKPENKSEGDGKTEA